MSDEAMQVVGAAPPTAWQNNENTRDRAWEKRRRQILRQLRKREEDLSNNNINDDDYEHDLTDEDMSELKACIELGFGFCEEEATCQEKRKLSSTLPALDLYFAVKRGRTQPKGGGMLMSSSSSSLSSLGSVVDSPSSSSSSSSSVGYSPTCDSDTWKIFNQGDDPKQVKMKLRHWAQAVACSVRQSH